MGDERAIRIAQSCALDPRTAAEELHRGLAQADMSLVLFFCGPAFGIDSAEDCVGCAACKRRLASERLIQLM